MGGHFSVHHKGRDQGVQEASRNWKRQGDGFPAGPREGASSAGTWFHPSETHFSLCPQNCELTVVRCFKSLRIVAVCCSSRRKLIQTPRLRSGRRARRPEQSAGWRVCRPTGSLLHPLCGPVSQERYTCPSLTLHPREPVFLAQTNGNYLALFSAVWPYRMSRRRRYEGHKVPCPCPPAGKLSSGPRASCWTMPAMDLGPRVCGPSVQADSVSCFPVDHMLCGLVSTQGPGPHLALPQAPAAGGKNFPSLVGSYGQVRVMGGMAGQNGGGGHFYVNPLSPLRPASLGQRGPGDSVTISEARHRQPCWCCSIVIPLN